MLRTPPTVATLRVLQGDSPERAFNLGARDYLIGRSTHCDLTLLDASVSREHARLVWTKNGFDVVDLGSRHGVLLDAQRVQRGRLSSGCLLQFGNVSLRYLDSDTEGTTGDVLPQAPAEPASQAAAAALDRLQLGVLLTGGNGRVLLSNHSAKGMLARADGLALNAGFLHAADAPTQAALRKLLCEDPGRGGALAVSRPSLLRPYALLVTPLGPGSEPHGAVKAVFLSDPEGDNATGAETLQRLYGLTPSEANLAVELLQGQSLEEGAAALGILVSTARTHLKHIFAKTATRRQSELVRLLLSGPVQLRAD